MISLSSNPSSSVEQPVPLANMAEENPRKCALCPEFGPKSCGPCQCIYYCSQRCKRKDAKSHKLVCKAFSDFKEIARPPYTFCRPAKQAKLALLLPQDSDTPELIWIMNDKVFGPNDTLSPLLDMTQQYPGIFGVGMDTELSSKDLGHAVLVEYCENFWEYPTQPNKCVLKAMRYATMNIWRGPIVIRAATHYDPGVTHSNIIKKRRQQLAGVQSLIDEEDYYLDIGIEDFRFAIYRMCILRNGYDIDPECEINEDMPKDPERDPILLKVANESLGTFQIESATAVKISCLGDQNFLGKEKFIPTQISRNHPIYLLRATDISEMMGLPLLICPFITRVHHSVRDWRSENLSESEPHLDFDPFQNHAGRILNLDVDARSEDWGLPNRQDSFDTILVTRRDQKRLALGHLEVWVMFCYHLSQKMEALRAEQREGMNQTAVVEAREAFMREHISRDGVEKFFENFKKEKVAAGLREWETVTSPFFFS